MKSTTVTISVETSDRIKALGGTTYEETIVEALDALDALRAERFESERFWAQAEAATAWRASLPEAERAEIEAREAALD